MKLVAPSNDNHGKQPPRTEIDWLFVVAIPVAIGYWIVVLMLLWRTAVSDSAPFDIIQSYKY